MKILITGANGQLGNELKSIIEKQKSEIGPIAERLKDVTLSLIDIESLDITVLDDVLNFCKSENYDIIINCAAYTNVDACEQNVDMAFKVNSIGPRNLAIAADAIGAKLVHVSTDYVFAGDANKPYKEYDLCDPQSVYGKTKLLGEEYVKAFCKRFFIVRTSWLYGYVGKNFVKTIMTTAKEKGFLKVVDDQRGNPTNANDLAHHILKLVATDEYGIYHCTGKGECSWFDFAKKIVELAYIDATVTPCTTDESLRPAKRPQYSSLDNMMLKASVGDEMRNWEEALKEYVEHCTMYNV